jgi:hypothetical protein
MSDHQRRMIRHRLKRWAFLEQELFALEEEIWQQMETSGLQPALTCGRPRLVSSRIRRSRSWLKAVRIGVLFPRPPPCSSWAGLCPAIAGAPAQTKGVERRAATAGCGRP